METLDEWDRHHWRNWSNAELKRFGLLPSFWDQHRRTNVYDLEWPARESFCIAKGEHTYPRPWHPPMSAYSYDPASGNYCVVCLTERDRK